MQVLLLTRPGSIYSSVPVPLQSGDVLALQDTTGGGGGVDGSPIATFVVNYNAAIPAWVVTVSKFPLAAPAGPQPSSPIGTFSIQQIEGNSGSATLSWPNTLWTVQALTNSADGPGDPAGLTVTVNQP